MINRMTRGGRHERRRDGLWLMEPCDRQLCGLHLFCLYVFQATDTQGLALVQRLQRVSGRIVRGDVRISADDLFSVRLAAVTFPGVDWFSHDAGHLLEMMFGWKTNPHFGPFHILSFVFIGGGFVLISAAWKVLFDAQKARSLATTGPYSYVRHPQYVGFILVMFGFLLQWPTILTLAMFPVLTVMYV